MVVAGSIVWFAIFCFASPEPTAWYLRKLFEQGEYSEPKDYKDIRARVKVIQDVDYDSKYVGGVLDVIRPREAKGKKLPVIFWMHGGAYVGGDKKEVEPYCICIADKGYAVVNFNYALAPEAHYPIPVLQAGEVYRYMERHADAYGIDMDNIYFAGDSAGAQIMSVFLNIQTNPAFAKELGLEPVVKRPIRGALLFCGPYDIRKLAEITTPVVGFMLDRAAWAYIGEKNWAKTPAAMQNDIFGKLTPDYPPTFLTDGNTMSFGWHMERMEKELKTQEVSVNSVYYTRKEKLLGHEYQFYLSERHAQETFGQVIRFLENARRAS